MIKPHSGPFDTRDNPRKAKADRLADFVRSLGIVWRASPRFTIWNIILSLFQGALPLLSLYLVKLIFDAAAYGLAADHESGAIGQVLLLVAAAGGVALFGLLSRQVSEIIGEKLSLLVAGDIQARIHAKSVEVDLEFYENAGFYDNLHRAKAEAPFRPVSIVNHLLQAFQSCLSLAGVAVLLLSFNWKIALVIFGAAVPAFLLRLRTSGSLYQNRTAWTPRERRLWYYDRLITGNKSAGELRLFNLGSLFTKRSKQFRNRIAEEKIKMTVKRSRAELLVQASTLTAVYVSLGFILVQTLKGAMGIGLLAMYYQAFQRVQGFLSLLLSGLAGIYEDSLFIHNFFGFIQLKPRVIAPGKAKRAPALKKQGIVFEDVSFTYPGAAHRALRGINLAIRPGEHVALTGENGSGKTTLIKLLCRLYDPDKGRITVDGLDLKEMVPEEWREKISGTFQDFVRYHDSARENIWFGDIRLSASDPKIQEAARLAGIAPVIEKFKRGYDTMLGKWLEAGEDMSSGEWQKLALARAFLREAPLIILDEPAGALDAMAAKRIFDNFAKFARERTAVVSSHRLSAISGSDQIFVLQNGSLLESGNHHELMTARGLYAGIFETQAELYR